LTIEDKMSDDRFRDESGFEQHSEGLAP
jgi:hypothetical protein